ncbi:hypothetical protein H5395_15345 [Paracoccus sp. MC1854]|uniref:hypothetical protein n=1 Tax=Paracoccus sp. MC1854 TaxID=2760306 RepID=UPI001604863B|nr:hypothetical protein [Paracoccus sp. MC1854]MBB1492870.1 hypothetical protein [Paracoccus sp. MC1854]
MSRNLQAMIEAFTAGLFAISAVLTSLRTVTVWDNLYTDPLSFDRPMSGRVALQGGDASMNLLGIMSQPANVILWGLMIAAVAAAFLHVLGRLQERFGPPLPRAINLGLLCAATWPWIVNLLPLAGILLAGLACILVVRGIDNHPAPARGMGLFPIAFLAGWLLMTTCSSLSLLIHYMGIGLERSILLGLLVAALSAVWLQLKIDSFPTFSLAVIWAMIGLASGTVGYSITIATACVLGISALAVVLVRVTT